MANHQSRRHPEGAWTLKEAPGQWLCSIDAHAELAEYTATMWTQTHVVCELLMFWGVFHMLVYCMR